VLLASPDPFVCGWPHPRLGTCVKHGSNATDDDQKTKQDAWFCACSTTFMTAV
jgi:hypothetical protein